MKLYVVIFTPRAERQLSQLYGYIADESGETQAKTYIGNIVATCNALASFPERGTKRDDIRPNLRTMGYAKSATIAFSVNTTTATVAIHGVFYGGQNFEYIVREAD